MDELIVGSHTVCLESPSIGFHPFEGCRHERSSRDHGNAAMTEAG
jgi:hypothetical protein